MSKAEDRANEKYRLEPCNEETQEKYSAYVAGYQQAEKDLELTWEDISDIIEIHEDVLEMESCENVYMEVLKRFKTMKATNIPTREELNKLENEYLNTIAKVKA